MVSRTAVQDFSEQRLLHGLRLHHILRTHRQVILLRRVDITVSGQLLHYMDRQMPSPVRDAGPTQALDQLPQM